MNRKKKINQTLIKRHKRKMARLSGNSNKPRYISKAERTKMDAEAQTADKEQE